MLINEIKVSEKDKGCLKELQDPKSIAEVAALLDTTYNYAFTKLSVWVAKKWVKKAGEGKKRKYYLNRDEIDCNEV